MNDNCHRICLTPARNEAWIIRQFVAAAKSWADHIIVADQGSSDGTLELLRAESAVDVVINNSPSFDEVHRQRLLIDRARRIPGKRVLIALDADEALSANAAQSAEWQRIMDAAPGTVLRFKWVNIMPGFQHAWIPDQRKRCGFIDDGREHGGQRIHNQRVPGGHDAPVIDLEEIVVLHFQYVVWERMRRKHRWYQVWEHLEHKEKRPLDIVRQYSHMFGSWAEHEMRPLEKEWLFGYKTSNIDFTTLSCEPITWWDREVARMLCEKGAAYFRKLPIWDQDWAAIASDLGLSHNNLRDPRSRLEKLAHRVLAATQGDRDTLWVRAFEKYLRLSGW